MNRFKEGDAIQTTPVIVPVKTVLNSKNQTGNHNIIES